LKEIEQQLTEKRIEFEELRERRHKQFRTGFELIAMHVKKIYRLITNGGDADLETIDALDPFSEGILF
jgi:structural maintenance of chromosome 4